MQHAFRQRLAGEHPQDADDPALDDERVAGERDHPFSPCPLPVTDLGIVGNVIGQVWLTALGDPSDLELAHVHAAVATVEVGVYPRAGL